MSNPFQNITCRPLGFCSKKWNITQESILNLSWRGTTKLCILRLQMSSPPKSDPPQRKHVLNIIREECYIQNIHCVIICNDGKKEECEKRELILVTP